MVGSEATLTSLFLLWEDGIVHLDLILLLAAFDFFLLFATVFFAIYVHDTPLLAILFPICRQSKNRLHRKKKGYV